jgi:hypothetical protein
LRLVTAQHLLAKERAAQVTAAELAEQRADSGAADAARILTGAASRGLPLKVSGLGGGWDGVHHALTTSGGDNMLAAVEEATLGVFSISLCILLLLLHTITHLSADLGCIRLQGLRRHCCWAGKGDSR